jgi:hypothetical protein
VGHEESVKTPEYHQPLCAKSCDWSCGDRGEMFGVEEKIRGEVGLCIVGSCRVPE